MSGAENGGMAESPPCSPPPTMNRPSSLWMRQYCMSVESVVSGGEGCHDGHGAGVVFGCCGCAVIGQLQVSVWFGVAFGQPRRGD